MLAWHVLGAYIILTPFIHPGSNRSSKLLSSEPSQTPLTAKLLAGLSSSRCTVQPPQKTRTQIDRRAHLASTDEIRTQTTGIEMRLSSVGLVSWLSTNCANTTLPALISVITASLYLIKNLKSSDLNAGGCYILPYIHPSPGL